MTPVRAASCLLALGAVLATVAPALGAPPSNARLQGSFALVGRVFADHVRGERTGQVVRRTWTFSSTCARGACPTVRLRRARDRGRADTLTLRRVAVGTYRGSGRFFFALRCGRTVLRRGGEVPFTIAVRITRVAVVQSTPFATAISATYANPRRINHTKCPGGLGRDSARYDGRMAGALPSPPQASFSAMRQALGSPTYTFRDTSRTDPRTAIVLRAWDFGDPASGSSNGSGDPTPSHTYPRPGTYTVTLTVTDGNGLRSTATQQVTV